MCREKISSSQSTILQCFEYGGFSWLYTDDLRGGIVRRLMFLVSDRGCKNPLSIQTSSRCDYSDCGHFESDLPGPCYFNWNLEASVKMGRTRRNVVWMSDSVMLLAL